MTQKEKQSPALQPRPLILIAIGLILILGAVIWMVLNPGQQQANAPRPTPTNNPNGPFPQISRVMLDDAKKALDEKSAVFLDVRSPESYNAAHVTGAINIPLAELESRSGELNPADWIITYCTWPAEESSARAADILITKGYQRVQPILGGFAAWQQAGYPVE